MTDKPPRFFLSDAEMRKAAPGIYQDHIRDYTTQMTEMFDQGCTAMEVATWLRDVEGVRPPIYADSYETYIENDNDPIYRRQQIYLLYDMVKHVRRKYGRTHKAAAPSPLAIELRKFAEDYRLARMEHAWLCRAEGMTLREIGERLGITKTRVSQMIHKFGRRVTRAIHGPRVTVMSRRMAGQEAT